MTREKVLEAKLLVAGGGSGGHVLAGIAVADAWCKKGNYVNSTTPVLFVGAASGIEKSLVPNAGYSLKVLNIGSLNRVSGLKKLKTLLKLPFSIIYSAKILLSFRPSAILGVGGYSSGPLVSVAWVLRAFGLLQAQITILEQNSVPGLTNRILGRFADIIFIAFPGTENCFPGRRVVLTGNPIRSSMKQLSLPHGDSFTLFIFGGSQGAVGMNTLILEALPYLKKTEGLKIPVNFIHQTGEKDFERVSEGYLKNGVVGRVEKFIYDMPAAYSEASLIVCRAGSSTLAEIAAVGRAALLIPLPTAADNHQEKNARVLADAGAAILISQETTSGEALAEIILNFYHEPERLRKMEREVIRFFRPQAAADIVEILLGSPDGVGIRGPQV